jgi:hypothetical protein
MTNYELVTPETISVKNEQFIKSTEASLNKILDILELPGVSVSNLSLDEATEIRKNLDPRFEGGQMKSRQVVNEEGKTRLPDELAQVIYEYAETNNMTYGSTEFMSGSYDVM